MKRLSVLVMLFVSMVTAMAQSDIDAYRFSQSNYEGTARFMGAGGAFGAVGAEFSALNTNPAAIGIYKKNEITFTPMVVSIFNDNTYYNGVNSYTSNTKYSLSNAGGVASIPLSGSWKAFQIGFGYNRTNDFNNVFRVEGYSNKSSIMNELVTNANTYGISSATDEYLAWQTYMIDTIPRNSNWYYSPFASHSVYQKRVVKSSGGIDELNFSFGGNYNDKLFLGATIGVPVLSYTETADYSEQADQSLDGIVSFKTYERLRVKSTGINLKIGVIYQPIEFLRIGASFHTPTYYGQMCDNFYKSMISYYDDGRNSGEYSYENNYKYTLNTPLRAIGSIAFLIKKRAFVSAEYEFTDYSMAKMRANDYSFNTENQNITDKYGACHKVRVGAEVYISNSFLLRAGYGYRSNGYKEGVNNDAGHTASGGFGIHTKYFLFDLAYVYNIYNEDYWLYDPSYVNNATIKHTTHRIVATIGCKF